MIEQVKVAGQPRASERSTSSCGKSSSFNRFICDATAVDRPAQLVQQPSPPAPTTVEAALTHLTQWWLTLLDHLLVWYRDSGQLSLHYRQPSAGAHTWIATRPGSGVPCDAMSCDGGTADFMLADQAMMCQMDRMYVVGGPEGEH